MPVRVPVIDQPAAQRAKGGEGRHRSLHELGADAKGGLAEAKVDDIRGLGVNRIHVQPRMDFFVPSTAERIAGLARGRGARLFPVHHPLDSEPHRVQPLGRHDVAQDQIALAAELLQIDVHEALLLVGRSLHGLFDQESVLLCGLFD